MGAYRSVSPSQTNQDCNRNRTELVWLGAKFRVILVKNYNLNRFNKHIFSSYPIDI